VTRINRHTIQDAPEASRPLLEGILPFSPTGQLAEAFAFLALTVFTAYFLNYAQTPMDLPASPAAADEPE
jgi:hypothetical protein